MATYTLIEVNGDHTHSLDDENLGPALCRLIRNPSNMQMMEHFGFDRAVRVVSTSMYPAIDFNSSERELLRTALHALLDNINGHNYKLRRQAEDLLARLV